eukprot:TRINITY_DN13311_c0_g1_i1.p1 TRINITY_DN13311_c0_g1~~TRINITY_DN13311_c0_g1_i1.p1  ORF type:complete len:394 (+),score=58.36 TRINITY_DN13311_c0_g1_i1:172-1353(+)
MNTLLKQMGKTERPAKRQAISLMKDSDVAKILKSMVEGQQPTGRDQNTRAMSRVCYSVLGKLQSFQDGGAEIGPKSICCAMWVNNKFGLPAVVPKLFSHAKTLNMDLGIQGWNILATAFGTMGEIDKMWNVINSMEKDGHPPNIYTFNNCMGACNRSGFSDQAFKLLEEMIKRKLQPDAHTWSRLILSASNVDQAHKIMDIMKRTSSPSFIHYNSVISVCLRDLDFGSAEECIYSMRAARDGDCLPNTTSYTSLMTIYSRLGKFKDMVRVYHTMRDQAISPNAATYIVFIGACNSAALKESGPDRDKYIDIANVAFKQAIAEGIDDHSVIITFGKFLHQIKNIDMLIETKEFLLDNEIDIPIQLDTQISEVKRHLRSLELEQDRMETISCRSA